jgi:hypothetical protein
MEEGPRLEALIERAVASDQHNASAPDTAPGEDDDQGGERG